MRTQEVKSVYPKESLRRIAALLSLAGLAAWLLAAQQLLEEKATQKEIAKKDAEIKIEEAKGIARAQKIINETLTANYLQHEAIMAQQKMASSPNHTTVYIPVGSNGIPIVYTPK